MEVGQKLIINAKEIETKENIKTEKNKTSKENILNIVNSKLDLLLKAQENNKE